MRNMLLCLAAAFSLLIVAPGVASAGTMEPIAQIVPPIPSIDGNAPLIFVAGGCGAGFHRGPRGGCRRNYYGRPVYRHPVRHYRRCVVRRTPYGPRRICRYY